MFSPPFGRRSGTAGFGLWGGGPGCFVTDLGQLVPTVTSSQMRAIDRVAMRTTGPTLLQMMENAGRHLADQAIEVLGRSWRREDILVLAGSGGNGAGGICAGRHLANRGARVGLILADPEHLGPTGRLQLRIYRNAGGRVRSPSALGGYRPGLILDALIGYGLSGEPRGPTVDLILWANSAPAPIISLDLPSGVNADRGMTAGPAIQPAVTVALALPKAGLAQAYAGEVVLADLGIPILAYHKAGIGVRPLLDARPRIPLRPLAARTESAGR